MAWIRKITPNEADGELKDTYRIISSARKNIANIHQVLSLEPEVMKAHWELYRKVMFTETGGLDRLTKERIGVLVSYVNGCTYCKRHHGEALRQLGEKIDDRLDLEEGQIPTSFPEKERSLLRWAVRMAKTPDAAMEEDIHDLRQLGYGDREILDMVLVISYFSFINRVVLMLGVNLESWFAETCGPLGDEKE